MTANGTPDPLNTKRKPLTARRLTLMASVAALGIMALAAGPASHQFNQFTHYAGVTSAQAAESAQAPAGFADLVAKVKPAVISVRVQMSDSGAATVSDD